MFTTTAHEVWEDLRTRFSCKNGPRIFQFRRQLMSSQQGSNIVSTYYTKLKFVWEELSDYKPQFNYSYGGLQHL